MMDAYAWIRKDLENALQYDGPIDVNAPMPQFWIKHMEEAMEKMRALQPLSVSFSEAKLNSAHENENFHVYSMERDDG